MSQLFTLEPKDPQDIIDYRIDWSGWLRDGDTIIASEWTVPDGIVSEQDSFNTTSTTIWLSGGSAGQSYSLTNHITTTQGREKDKTITVRVKEL